MRISGHLWGHCIRVLRVEWAGWSFFAVKCLRLTLGFVPIEASIVTHEWLKHEKISTAKSWDTSSLKFELNTTPGYFFLNGTETEMRQPSLTVAFCNTCTVLSIIHDVFSLTVPWTMRSTPVCLFQKEPCGMREHVPEVHTLKKACSHLVLEKITCRRLCGSHWRWEKFIWLINSWSISSVKLYATAEFPVLSRNQAARLPLR